MRIKVETTAPNGELWKEWNIQEAFPLFIVEISSYSSDNDDVGYDSSISVAIEGHYYVCGSTNFEIKKIYVYGYDGDIDNNFLNSITIKIIDDVLKNTLLKSMGDSILEVILDKLFK